MTFPIKMLWKAMPASLALLALSVMLSQAPQGVLAAKPLPTDLKFYVFTEKCFEKYFSHADFLDVECMRTTISKGINLGIIAGAFIFKVPQVFNIIFAGDVQGLSAASLYMDVASFLPITVFNILNGNDFVTYGEQLVVLTQNILIVALFWYYLPTTEKPSILFMLSVATTIFGSGFGLLYGLPPMLWWILPICSSVFNIMSRIPQIATNFANKHTGRLSVITWFLQVGGSLGRLFTNLQEEGISESSRPWIIGSTVVGVTLNVVILMQILFYWRNTKAKLGAKKE